MGETALDRGLLSLRDGTGPTAEFQLEWLWLMLSLHAHRFSGRPIGEALASWTNIILIHNGHHPTIGDIARASGLPRATVSRYVNHTIEQGWAEERVNQQDRRRRELFLTESGARELERIVEIFHQLSQAILSRNPKGGDPESGADLLERLEKLSSQIIAAQE